MFGLIVAVKNKPVRLNQMSADEIDNTKNLNILSFLNVVYVQKLW